VFQSTDPQAGLPVSYTFTSADNGVKTIDPGILWKTSGTQIVSVVDHDNPALRGEAPVTVAAAAPATLSLKPSVDPPVAGVPFDVTVVAKDPFGNTAVQYSGSMG